MDVFESCQKVNDLITAGQETEARNELIQLLAKTEEDGIAHTPLINHMIRGVGLFPYMQPSSAEWEDQYVYEAFKVDVGGDEPITLHREQSRLLAALLDGDDIAVSAPTSFGKSFVIDAFIAIRKPKAVVILVPTIALADETRRRLHRKFGRTYRIVTAGDQELGDRNIFVFPPERSLGYADILEQIDILIVDEFYKASASFDRERSPTLVRAILAFSRISDQRYFLAPNISDLTGDSLTNGMQFLRLDFNTVYLEKTDLSADIGRNAEAKSDALLRILEVNEGKTLIYAGTYANIKRISILLIDSLESVDRPLLNHFQSWLATNYDANWELTKLVTRGVGVHNGQLHRSLSQIQIRLFEEEQGLDSLVSTSSIIEGVNTSARNVVLWSNRNGRARIDDFTYRNIVGRSGRMFRHFIGKVFILETPPPEGDTQLDLEIPDDLLGLLDAESSGVDFTAEQLEAIHAYEEEMRTVIGSENLQYLQSSSQIHSSNKSLVLEIARNIRADSAGWNGLGYLNSNDPDAWDRLLYRLLRLQPGGWDTEYRRFVGFVKVLSQNWAKTIPELLEELNDHEIGIEDFFKLERNTTFKLATLLGDVQVIYNRMMPTSQVDLSPAITRLSNAFLPPLVYHLEEYGIPRTISRKIHVSGEIDLERTDIDIHQVLDDFSTTGFAGLTHGVGDLDEFDKYILKYFFEGISTNSSPIASASG